MRCIMYIELKVFIYLKRKSAEKNVIQQIPAFNWPLAVRI